MGESPPIIYLLHGEDEFEIAGYVSELESKLGDPGSVAMNLTRLDGRSYNLDELLSVAGAIPFLTSRRLVVLTHPSARLTSKPAQKKFTQQLEQVPPTTALVLIEDHILTTDKDRRKGKIHWLEKWALGAGDRVYIKACPLPKGRMMGRWIQDQAKKYGGSFTPGAADLLGSLVGGDPRLADQEINKLLAYVNYKRPVEVDDIELLTPDAGQGNIFVLVDSLAGGDGRGTMNMLHRLLEVQDGISIFGMVVRQFRLLILTREILDEGDDSSQVARQLKTPLFLAEKLTNQARRFRLTDLETTYHRLLELDEAMKTGEMASDLALETFVANFTLSLAQP
jgi:DNA polymerase-3 subunit delta